MLALLLWHVADAGAQRIAPARTVRAVIHAALSEDSREITGEVTLSVTNNTGSSLREIPISMYANRFQEVNPNLDDRMIRWIYPSGESTGGISIQGAQWNNAELSSNAIAFEPTGDGESLPKNIIAKVKIPSPLEAGSTGELELGFRVEIPERRGRFGRWDGVVSLGGGWFPRPLTDLSGQDTGLPPDSIEADVMVSLPAGRGAVLHDRVFNWNDKARIIEAKGIRTEAITLVVMDLMEIDTRRFDWGEVIHVHRDLRNKGPKWKDTRADDKGLPNGLPDLGEVDISKRIFGVIENTARLVRESAPRLGLPERLVLVDIPAWDRIAQQGPGPILVSDRLWTLFPVEAALWFHDLALARATAAQFAWQGLQAKEKPEDRYIVADVIGSYFAERYSKDIHKKSRTVKDLIGFLSFVPTVDNLLYAPEIPFREVYYQSVEEPDLLRDEPWRSANRLPRGKRVLGKFEDLVGRKATDRLIRDLMTSDKPFEDLVLRELGRDGGWFFDQWLGDYPKVNYLVGEIEDAAIEGGIRHRVEVKREGDQIREPVTVRIIDDDNLYKDVIWDGQGERGLVEWISKAPLDNVRIDPEGRLVEAPELIGDHPLADNYDRLPWRPPMVTRVLISGDLTAGDVYVDLGARLRRMYDVSNTFSLSGSLTPRSYGGAVGYYRSFGPKRTLNYRTWYLGPTLGVTRYLEVTDAGPELPPNTRFAATAGSVGLALGRDDRSYFYDPRSGLAFWVVGSYSAGMDDEGRTVQVGRLHTNLVKIFSPAIRHTFALSTGAMGLVGDPAAAQLHTLSVREVLRGFDVDETYGRVGLYAVAEYRHLLIDGSYIKAPAFSWFDRFQGVLFVGGGTISKPDDYGGLFSEDRIYTEIGYGLRVHTLALGVQQHVIGLDLAFPLTPTTRQSQVTQADGSIEYRNRAPFKLIFGVMQTF
jgi:hypothetical protein